MEHSPLKYIILYDGCGTEDIRYCDDIDTAQTEMVNMAGRLRDLGVNEKPYIMEFGRNTDGDYELRNVFGRNVEGVYSV